MPIFRLIHHIVDVATGHTQSQHAHTYAHAQQQPIVTTTPQILLAAPVRTSCRGRCWGCCRRERRRARRECRHGLTHILTPFCQTHWYHRQQPPYLRGTVEAPEMWYTSTPPAHNIRPSRSEGNLSGDHVQETGVAARDWDLPPAYAEGEWNHGTKMPEKKYEDGA